MLPDFPRNTTDRREFLKLVGGFAVSAGMPLLPKRSVAAEPVKPPETLVKLLYDTFSPVQREQVCFGWDHVDEKRGLLRTRIENNWKITRPSINSEFYTAEQQDLIRQIFLGMTHPDWHKRFDEQLLDDVGGFGNGQSIAIFGQPGTNQFEFVLASRHMTLRCDGNSAGHVAFGGPILSTPTGGRAYEKPTHPSNVFWPQAIAANALYEMFDGKQRSQAALVIRACRRRNLSAFAD